MNLLASICNVGGKCKSGLLFLDEWLSAYQYIKLPDGVGAINLTGIAVGEDVIAIACQDGAFLLLDRQTFSLKDSRSPQKGFDTHSILLHENKLYAVATRLNAVVVMDIENGKLGPERVHWKLSEESYGADNDHLNSIALHQGRLLVSGFGRRETKLWSSAKNGFVIDIASGNKIHEGLCQPHTLTPCGDSMFICESAKSTVLDLSCDKSVRLGGYARGLCVGQEGIYAAVSKGRTVSKSTGLVTTNTDDGGEPNGCSAIYLIDRETFKVKKGVHVGELEFYDLAMVGDEAFSWPIKLADRVEDKKELGV